MDVHKVSANDKVATDVNHLAVERGPIVYCAEFAGQWRDCIELCAETGNGF